jgi:Iap family predicted aminopeptidase
MLRSFTLLALASYLLSLSPVRAEETEHAAKEAHAFLTRLCDDFGGRLTGTSQNRAALEALAAELRALGYAPRFDEFDFPGWKRGEDSVELVAPFPRQLRTAALAYSPTTPEFEAEVIDLGDFAAERTWSDAAGKVGLLSPSSLLSARQIGRRAAELGLKAVLFINREAGGQLLARTGSFVGEPLPMPIFSVTQEDGQSLQRVLARGGAVRVRCVTASRPVPLRSANLVLRIPGRSPERVIVGAHFDSWDLGQGALDNGLGVAQLYALARKLRGIELARTVDLVWFNGEEQGLWGSRHAAAGLGDAPVVAMMNLDMVGVPIAVNALGDEDLATALERWHRRRTKPLPQGVQNVNWFGSDHTPYQLVGVRTVTFHAPIPREAVRYYHDYADTIDKLPEQIVVDSTPIIFEVLRALVDDAALTPQRRSPEATQKLFTAFGLEPRMRSIGYWPFATRTP